MSKIMQNLVVLMKPIEFAYDTPLKGGKIILNRFCIDEDAAFELSGVHFLETSVDDMPRHGTFTCLCDTCPFKFKGKKFSFLFVLIEIKREYRHKIHFVADRRIIIAKHFQIVEKIWHFCYNLKNFCLLFFNSATKGHGVYYNVKIDTFSKRTI